MHGVSVIAIICWIFLLLLGYGKLGAVDMRDILAWFMGVALPGKRFYGIGILKKDIQWPPYGTWEGQLGFLVIGRTRSRKSNGEWRRKGRVVFFWSAPKRQPLTKLKPRMSFG